MYTVACGIPTTLGSRFRQTVCGLIAVLIVGGGVLCGADRNAETFLTAFGYEKAWYDICESHAASNDQHPCDKIRILLIVDNARTRLRT